MGSIGEPGISGFLKTPAGRRIGSVAVFISLFFIFFFWFRNIILAAVISACISIYIAGAFNSLEMTRTDRLHRQLVGFLEHMIIILRAGKTIRHIFQESWSSFPRPLGSYLKDIAEKLEIDPDLEHALDMFEERSGSREVKLIAAGIKINSRIGGDLIILLESISVTLRESLRARSRMQNLTMQSRLSANIISLFPVAALLFLSIFYNSSIIDFFSTTAGTIVLIAGGLLEITGIIFMKMIIKG